MHISHISFLTGGYHGYQQICTLYRHSRNSQFHPEWRKYGLYPVRKLLAVHEKLSQTIDAINGIEAGHITIACFASISRNWLPKIIYTFRQNYPGVEIELMEGGTDDIVSWVVNQQADFGLLSRRHVKGLEWISLYEDPLMAVLPKDYPLENESAFAVLYQRAWYCRAVRKNTFSGSPEICTGHRRKCSCFFKKICCGKHRCCAFTQQILCFLSIMSFYETVCQENTCLILS